MNDGLEWRFVEPAELDRLDKQKLLESLVEAINAWPEFDGQEEVGGADLADWFDGFRRDAIKVVTGQSYRSHLRRVALLHPADGDSGEQVHDPEGIIEGD